jgi:hypothetical protein
MARQPGEERVGDRILDLAVYAPVGLVVSVAEAVPGLVQKGRERLAPQVVVARTVGEFAVRQGYRRFLGLATSRGAFRFGAFRFGVGQPAKTYPAYTAQSQAPGDNGAQGGGPERAAPLGPQIEGTEPVAPPPDSAQTVGTVPEQPAEGPAEANTSPSAAELAIPSYDSLSAPQVVQRLAGLSREEIEAVAAYEAGTRRRKTVLDRAEQLLTEVSGTE